MLDRSTKALLDDLNRAQSDNIPLPMNQWSVSVARREMNKIVEVAVPRETVHKTTTLRVGETDVKVRIYWPRQPDAEAKLPALCFYHGGGFVLGDIEIHDNTCRYLCNHANTVIINVDYRLAPEHPFPAAVIDADNALNWVADNAAELGVDDRKLIVCGDSAGGNLAIVLSQLCRDRGGPALAMQIPIYPCTDMRRNQEYPSEEQFGQGEYYLYNDDTRWLIEQYLPTQSDELDPRASPILAEYFENLPPALIITAGYDPLVDQGRAYANKLNGASVEVTYQCFEGTIHGFLSFGLVLDSATKALDLVACEIDRTVNSKR